MQFLRSLCEKAYECLASLLSPPAIFTLILVLSLSMTVVPVSSIEPIGILCGVLAIFATTKTVFSNAMQRSIWLLIPLAIALKLFSHLIALSNGSDVYAPYSVAYIINSFSSLLLLVFGILLFRYEDRRLKTRGILADLTLLIVAGIIFLSAAFPNFAYQVVAAQITFGFSPSFNLVGAAYILIINVMLYALRPKALDKHLLIYIAALLIFLKNAIAALVFYQPIELIDPELGNRLVYASVYMASGFATLYLHRLGYYRPPSKALMTHYRVSPLVLWSIIALIMALPLGEALNDWRSHLEHTEGLIYVAISLIILLRITDLARDSNNKQAILESEASIDHATGLYNRFGLKNAFNDLKPDKPLLLGSIEIENLSAIINLHDFEIGDQVLRKIASHLQKHPDILLAARINNSELIFVFDGGSITDAKPILSHLQTEISAWHSVPNHANKIWTQCAIGIANITPFDFKQSYRHTCQALLKAKNTPNKLSCNAGASMLAQPEQLIIEAIERAIADRKLIVDYQGIHERRSHNMAITEALMRLPFKTQNKVTTLLPGHFMAIAKSSRKMTELTLILLEVIATHHPLAPNVATSINVNPELIEADEQVDRLINKIKELNIAPVSLVFELTEIQETNMQALARNMHRLSQLGFRFALDDFGAGSSSLKRISSLPITYIKLDISLLRAAQAGQDMMIKLVTNLAHELNHTVIAEGAESIEDIRLLEAIGVDYIQGYFLSRPMSNYHLIKHTPTITPYQMSLPISGLV